MHSCRDIYNMCPTFSLCTIVSFKTQQRKKKVANNIKRCEKKNAILKPPTYAIISVDKNVVSQAKKLAGTTKVVRI